jgi:superfamily II DNA/RNA helicase
MTTPAAPERQGFADLGVPDDLCQALAGEGITEPFEIQRACLPAALAGRDLCGRAPTGSGKTLAYGIALLHRVSQAEPSHPTGIVLVPTRELAKQIRYDLVSLGKARQRYILAVYGGTSYEAQLRSFRLGASVLVACPGRLADFVRRGQVHLDAVEVCVIDEADRMAELGFIDDVRALLDAMPAKRQTMLFSATLDHDVDDLVQRYQRQPVTIDVVGPGHCAGAVSHRVMVVRPSDKVATAAGLVRSYGRTMVFTGTRDGADEVASSLRGAGLRAAALHGGMTQPARERSLEQLRRGQLEVLVATDVAARGIHVGGVELVIHWDVALDAKDYVHRSGRTARAGEAGTVVTLATDHVVGRAARITRSAGVVLDMDASRPTRTSRRRDDAVTTVAGLAGRRSGRGRPSPGRRPS